MSPHRNTSNRTIALNLFKAKIKQKQISADLDIPLKTLKAWIVAAKKAWTFTDEVGVPAEPAPKLQSSKVCSELVYSEVELCALV